jgi:hypothetical protein
MNTEAIERIKGYCCEVTRKQWDELVRVANLYGFEPSDFVKRYTYAFIDADEVLNAYSSVSDALEESLTIIPYPDFLAKLKGEEKWEPKNGEHIYVKGLFNAMFIGMHGENYVVHDVDKGGYTACSPSAVAPLRQTITRTEAESLLKKRIID